MNYSTSKTRASHELDHRPQATMNFHTTKRESPSNHHLPWKTASRPSVNEDLYSFAIRLGNTGKKKTIFQWMVSIIEQGKICDAQSMSHMTVSIREWALLNVQKTILEGLPFLASLKYTLLFTF